jgi:ribonuclease HII
VKIISGVTHLVGIDEVGRGPLAGPVTVCACKVAHDFNFKKFRGIKDSKMLTAEEREKWFIRISKLKEVGDLDFAHFSVPANEIDTGGLAPAIRKALAESLEALALIPEATFIKLDGALKAPAKYKLQETIIRGDEKIPLISAASIVAKVMRDRHMVEQSKLYPAYGFERHKGYGTEDHYRLIKQFGISPIHRKSFLKSLSFL